MSFTLSFTPTVKNALKKLKEDEGLKKRYRAVEKTLRFLSANPKHPGLQTRRYVSLSGPNEEKVFEAYAEQETPGAYRIFFYYGPSKGEITIFTITPNYKIWYNVCREDTLEKPK